MDHYSKLAGEALGRLRSANPVVHSITNYVVMNSTANVLLAMGASPIMAHATEELNDIVNIASSIVINIGTLSSQWIESMNHACRLAKVAGKPLVLDPVGSGATKFRTDTACNIVKTTVPTVVRGNASEILSLSPQGGTTRGVDSLHTMEDAFEAAKAVAAKLGTCIAVTGERDLVTDGSRSLVIANGHSFMRKVTGTGCAATVIVAAFLAVESDPVIASAAALAFFGLAGEKAAAESSGPGTFWQKTLDALYNVTPKDLEAGARITEA
ncbi:MAG: hydroxyethylthiazole kinase [Desulfomonile tiedjei]|uniref:Hydroxyethylthiazole kinase n=1 Tax=Desulfomonile tiedjei TaxID=2358 RepID=A0A9D6Z1W7_9BACT|nr:hydroxyethylthiazole kinase [Desulfomonile tiedjei]